MQYEAQKIIENNPELRAELAEEMLLCEQTTPKEDFGCFTAEELVNEVVSEIKWVVPEVLPEGLVLLAGRPKIGKSWLMMGLSITIAEGGNFLGKIPVDEGRVLYLALEDNKRRLKSRLSSVLSDKSPPNKLHFATSWEKADQGGIQKIEEFIKKYPDTRLVIIDTLQKFKSKTKSNSNTLYADDYSSVEGLKGVADKFGIGILLIHHVRKSGSDDIYETISGTTGLTGGVDGIMVLQRDRTKADAVLSLTGRDVMEKELALSWDEVKTQWNLMGDANEYRVSQERQRIIDVLKSSEVPLTPKEVSSILNKNYNTIKVQLSSMWKDGQIKKYSEGKYYINNNINSINPINPIDCINHVNYEQVGLGLSGDSDTINPKKHDEIAYSKGEVNGVYTVYQDDNIPDWVTKSNEAIKEGNVDEVKA